MKKRNTAFFYRFFKRGWAAASVPFTLRIEDGMRSIGLDSKLPLKGAPLRSAHNRP
jgi:hypothetical protein